MADIFSYFDERAIAEKGITYLPGGAQKAGTGLMDMLFPEKKTQQIISTTLPSKWYSNIPRPVIYGVGAGAALLLVMAIAKRK